MTIVFHDDPLARRAPLRGRAGLRGPKTTSHSRRADDGNEPIDEELLVQRGDVLFAPEEEVVILGFERPQAGKRGLRRCTLHEGIA
jgi:hypothetical protein